MSAGFQLYALMFVKVSIFLNGFQDCCQLVAKENRYDSRRSFVAAQSVVISGAGCGYTHQICIFVNSFDNSHQEYQELDILIRSFTRV